MFLNIIYLGLACRAIAAATTILHTDYGDDYFVRFNADFIESNNEVRTGTAELNFGFGDRSIGSSSVNGLVGIKSVLIGSGIVKLDMSRLYHQTTSSDPRMTLSAGPRAMLMRASAKIPLGLLLAPLSRETGVLVINPRSPSLYASKNRIVYTEPIDTDSLRWEIPMAVRLSGDAADTFDPNLRFGICSLREESLADSAQSHLPTVLIVPKHIMNGLNARMAAAGVIMIPSSKKGFFLENFDESLLDSLPGIEFIMRTESYARQSFVTLSPRDYITKISDGKYFLRLRSMPATNDMEGNACSLDRTILRKFVIHFDPMNNRIGFGKPQIDL